MASPLTYLRDDEPEAQSPLAQLREPEVAPPSIAEGVETRYGNEFTKGFRRGALGLAGTSIAAIGQIAETFGAKEKAAGMFDEARQLTDFPQGLRPRVETWDDVNDTSSLVDYGLSKMGEAAPSSLLSIGAGAAGGVAGLGLRALGARALGPNVMGYAAGAGSMLPAEAGEAALTMQNDPQAMANTTPGERLAIAGGKGAVNAALEFLPERLAFGRAFTRPLVGKAGLGAMARNTAIGGAEGALGEAATEASQEFTGQIAHGLANPQRDTSQDLIAMREAALGGAFGGAPMGASAGLVQGTRENLAGAMERGKGSLKKAQDRGILPTVEDAATFLRRAAQEPEFLGEQAEAYAEQGVDAAKRGWKTIGEISARAADKGEAIVAEANKTLFDAIGAYKDLDKPGEEVNREFLLGLQNNIANMTKDTYFALKELIKDPTSATTRQQLGYYAKGLGTETLPAAAQRSMDWLSRVATGWKRSVDKKVRASVSQSDAKEKTREALASIKDKALDTFRGLPVSDQRTLVNAMFSLREAPKLITPAVRKEFETVTGLTIEEAQSYADAEVQVAATEADKKYREQMVRKIASARREMATLQSSGMADASPELRQQVKARIAEKYGLKLNDIDTEEGTRTEATFDSDEQVIDELEDLDRTREGTIEEIEPPVDPVINQEVLNNSIQNLHYYREAAQNEDPETPRAHMWVTLRPDKNDPKAPTPRDILESFNAEDSMYTGGPRRKFTAEEVAEFTNEDGSVRLPIRPMSLSVEMQRNKSTKDALDQIRKGQTGGSLSRKGDLLMTGLSTLMNNGLKWTDSKGVEHKLAVEPEFEDVPVEVGPKGQIIQKVEPGTVARTERRLPRNILVGAAKSKKLAKDRHAAEAKDQTLDTYLNEKPAWTPRSAEALSNERELIEDLRSKFDMLDSFRFNDYIKKLSSPEESPLPRRLKKPFARWRAMRGERAEQYIADAEARALADDVELTPDQKKEIVNDAWRRATDEVTTEIGNTNLRATVNDGLKTVFEDVQSVALDRQEAGERTVALVDSLMRYLETNGEDVAPEVNALFRDNNIRLFTPKMLNDPALKYDDGGTPQERYLNQLQWLKTRAEENNRGGLFAQAEGNDWETGANRLNETSPEVVGGGNNVWDQGSFAIPTEPVTKAKKDDILNAFAKFTKDLNLLGKFRIESPGKKKFRFGFFKTEQDARDWLDAIPADGVKGLLVKVEGDKHLYTFDEAQAKWPWKEFDEDGSQTWEKKFRKDTRKATIINPDSGEFLRVGNVEFSQMSPYFAAAHLKELARMVYDAKNAKVVDATPMYTWTPPQPVRKGSETDEEYMARVRATVKPATQPLTYAQLEKLIRTKEAPDRNAKTPLAKPAEDPQGKLDLQDDVMAEENKMERREPAPPRPTDFQEITADKQGKLDLFEPTETPKPEVERHYQMRNKAGLSGETTMNPMYLWKRSLKRSVVAKRREEAKAQEEVEPTPKAAPKTVTDDFGNEVRRDYRGEVVSARGKDVVPGKPFTETDATPARDDEDLLGFSRTLQKKPPPAKDRRAEPNRVTGDIWEQDGFKIVTTNLAGVHGRGLAKQAKDKGLIDWKNREFGASPFDKKIITLAVKGKAPETAKIPGKKWSESVTGENIELLRSELRKLLTYARKNPNEKFYLPYAGLGFGEGDPAVITPMLEWMAREPNIFLIGRGDEVQQKYPESLKPGVRRDATTRVREDSDLTNDEKAEQSMPEDTRLPPDTPAEFSITTTTAATYPDRTRKNAQQTDATWAAAVDFNSRGEQFTAKVAGKKLVQTPLSGDVKEIANTIIAHLKASKAKSLNIAGNGLHTLKKRFPNFNDEQLQAKVDKRVLDILTIVHAAHPISEIRTGGQTGVDEAGAKAGRALGIPTKVLMPAGYRIRNGAGKDLTQTKEQAEARYAVQSAPASTEREQAPKVNTRDDTLEAYGGLTGVAGEAHHIGRDPTVRANAVLDRKNSVAKLVREKDNAHDSNAIQVLSQGKLQGYIPKPVAATLAPLIDAGGVLRGRFNEKGHLVDLHIEHADDSKLGEKRKGKLAFTDKDGVIHIVKANVEADLANGFKYLFSPTSAIESSRQKAKVAKELGLTKENFGAVITSFGEYRRFLLAHEQSHVNNKDAEKYPRKDGKYDLMHADALAIEKRATEDGLKAVGWTPTAVEPERVYEDSDLTNEERAELSMPEDTRLPEDDDEIDRLNTPHKAGPKKHFVPMTYRAAKGQLRPELNKKYPDGAPLTLLIKNGDRTATTRPPQAGVRKGDTIKFYGSPQEYVVTGFERVDQDTPEGRERWSKREGWSTEGVKEAGHGNQVKTGTIQMIWEKKEEKPVVKEQRTGKKNEPFVGPPEELVGPPQPEFIGPPTARDLGIMKKDQEALREVPKDVPKKIADLVEKIFDKKVKIIIGAPDGKQDSDATAWYVGRKQLDSYKKNMADIQATRAARRKALREKDFGLANDLRKKEEELLKQTQAVGLIYLSPKLSEAEQLGAFYHEAVHAAFDILLSPEQRAILGTAFSQGLARNKLRQIFKDDPVALEHMQDEEEAAAYAFQVWAVTPEKLQLGGKVQGVFNKIKQFFRKLMGILTPEEKANILFNDMLSGRMANEGLSSLQKQLDKDMTLKDRTIKTARDMAMLVHRGWNVIATNNYDRLMQTGNPALQRLAQAGYVKTGEDRNNGMVQRWFQQQALWLNKLDKAMKGFSPEAVKEAMEARIHERQPKGAEVKQAYDAMEKYFDEMHEYFKQVDPDNVNLIGWEKHYFPNMWDPEKVMKDRDGFLAMVNKPEYAEYLEELKVTPSELWEHISGYLIRGESFQNVVNERTNEPINEYAQKRSLSFMTPEDRRPFLQDDPIHVMLHYTKQMVRHAEFMRAYGVGGGELQTMLDEAENKYGATKDQLELAQDYIDGLLGNKEVGMSRELKDVYGAITTYQSFRLLPFSLFSSLVDPLGIAVRSNNMTDALETFTYSLKNIFRDLRKRDDLGKDYWERLAEDWGIIEDAQVLANIHNMYESIELRGFTKRLNEGLFKYNLLNGWVRSTKIMAVKASHRFILRAGQDQLGDDSTRYLEELGLKKSDVVATPSGGLAVTKDELMAQGVSEEQAVEIEKRLQAATTKFVNQAVLNPTAADLPNWGSNPYFAPIFHLKQFMFTFQNVILARIAHEMSQGNYKPLWISTIFVPGMIAADALRGFVSNMGEEPPWQKDWTAGDYLVNGVERSGLLGTGALLTSMKDDMMHGGQGYESLSGPTIEQLKKGTKVALGQGDAGNFIVKSMPLNPIYDQWLLSSGGKEQ